ncbi:MAG: sigma-54-dependent Fis family transcriptional regulator, partial [Planctomycetes bacterium]|nr:sigma-54-dependent Fis family transcriptional regulator [Planctomycetota bacterium]
LASFHDNTEVLQLRDELKKRRSFHGIIGADDSMQEVYELIGDLAVSDCSVLIQGESGTGKELVAGAIHGESRRSGRPFVTVNCGALPEGVLESELFGHVRGAFTGAVRDKKGRFELADGGTLFLDEVGELSANMQVKLLRVLQEGTFHRVGGEKQVRVDVRVLSATNRELREMVKQGIFREDLFYRLCVVPVILPPLRMRRTDIQVLVKHFIERFGKNIDRPIHGISPDAMHCLIDYHWPGNIRELQNAIQYAFVKCKNETLKTEHLPPEILTYLAENPSPEIPSSVIQRQALYGRRRKLNMAQVKEVLQETNGNKLKAAQRLGVGRATLYRFLKDYGNSI